MHQLGIDVETREAKNTMRRLAKLKTTIHIEGPYAYNMDKNYCQILVDTELSEEELENWLWKTKGIAYLGVFVRG